MSPNAISFEENLKKLNKVVEDLESGNLSLKESLEKFQSGVDTIKQCYGELKAAELKIEKIMKKDGKIIAVPINKDYSIP